MTGTVLNELKNQKNDIFKNQFCISKCSSTSPSRCIIKVSTNDWHFDVACYKFKQGFGWLEYCLYFNDFKLIDPDKQYICSKSVQKTTLVRGFFLLEFEQVFAYRIYFNSVHIIPVGTMLFSNFLADVNLDVFNIL